MSVVSTFSPARSLPEAPPQQCTRPTSEPAQPVAAKPTSVSSDDVKVSSQANEGMASVKTDSWKKGKNDCLEHILVNQGYSMKEIYGKGADGKTLMQSIAAQNGLKDPNLLRPGQELKIPKKGEAASTEGLKKGETATAKAEAGERSTTLTAERTDDGKKTMTTAVNNGGASLEVRSEVGDKGRVDANVRREGDQVVTQEVAKNSNGSAITQTTATNGPEGTRVQIRDTDKKGPNSTATVDESGNVTFVNPGAKGTGDVRTTVGNNQGLAERVGEWGDNVGRWITGDPRGDKATTVTDARGVDVNRRQDGSQTTTIVDAQGEKTVHNRGADGILQQGGRWVDEQASSFGKWTMGLFGY